MYVSQLKDQCTQIVAMFFCTKSHDRSDSPNRTYFNHPDCGDLILGLE